MCGGCIINAEMPGGFIKKSVFISVILVLISVGMVSATGNEIRVTYTLDDLDDKSSNGDDYYQVNDSLVRTYGRNQNNSLNLSTAGANNSIPFIPVAGAGLKFDANGNGNLRDSGDYVFYDGVYIINGSDGTIRMGYDISAHYVAGYYNSSNGPKPGEVVKLKGSKYAITDVSEFDSGKIQIGPARVKTICDTGTLDPDSAVVIAENYKVFYDQDGTTYKIHFYEGNSLLDTYTIPSTGLPASTKINDYVELGSFEDKYDIYVVAQDISNWQISMSFVDKDQIIELTDEGEGVFGYDLVWINNENWNDSIVLFSPVIQLVRNDTIELPGTHHVLEWTDDKELDIKRIKKVVTSDNSRLRKSSYPKLLSQNIDLSIVGGSVINITWSDGSIEVEDESVLNSSVSPYSEFLIEQVYIEILAKPDLTISEYFITFSGDRDKREGESITISADVQNIKKDTNENFTVEFYDGDPDADGTLIGTDTITIGTPATVVWTAVNGTHDITVVVDSTNSTDEWNETNNVGVRSVYIIPLLIPGADIRISYYLDDLDDDSSNGDDYYQVNDNLVRIYSRNQNNSLNLSIAEANNPIPSIPVAGNGLMFDANGDGDLKDSGDYILYDGVYIIDGSDGTIRMGYNISAHYVEGYYNSSDGPKPGEVVKIKGSKYAITDVSNFGSGEIEMGPAIVKKISDTGDLNPDRAVTIAENYKVFYDQNSTGAVYKVYFYEGNSLLDTYQITGKLSASTKLNDAVELGSFEDKYNIYVVTQDTNAESIGMSFVDKDQIIDLTDGEEGVMGYDVIWINNENWNNGIVFFSPVIRLVRNDTIELPGTYYMLEWTDDRKLDIKRKFQVVVPDVSALKALRYDEFLTDDINVTIVETGINVMWGNGSVVVEDESKVNASQYSQFLSTDIYIEILAKPDLTISEYFITLSGDRDRREGESITISADVQNIKKDTNESFTVEFYDGDPDAGGTLIGTDTTTIGTPATVVWTAVNGTHNITVVVDSTNSTDEWNETNNVGVRSVYIIPLLIPGADIRISYYLDDLDDDSSNGDDYYQVNDTSKNISPGANASNKLKLSSYNGLAPPFVSIAGAGLKFDANGDGDLKDSGDYVFYDGVYIINGSDGTIRMGYDISAHYAPGYYNSSDGPKPGEVVNIKGSKYAITDMSEFDSGKIQIGPVMVKKISDTGTLDPDRAVTIAENYKVFYDQNSYASSYKIYFYEGNSLLDTYTIPSGGLPASTRINDYVELGSFEDKYNIYAVTQDISNSRISMSFIDKDQIFELTDEEEGIFGYDVIWINNEKWENGIVLFSPVIQLAWNDTIELPGTYYVLEWTDDKKLDIKREFQVVVPDVSTLKASRYDEFLTDNINVTIVETGIDGTGINITWGNGSVVVEDESKVNASPYSQFLSTDIYIEILAKPDLTISEYFITLSGDRDKREGESITISADVQNIKKDTNESFTVEFYDGDPDAGGTLIGTDTTTIGTPATVMWTAVEGTHDITVVVDSTDSTDEWNETNNVGVRSVYIIPLLIPGAEIRISYYFDDLDDDSSNGDDYYQVNDTSKNISPGANASNKLKLSSYNGLAPPFVSIAGAGLKFDANGDGDLEDSGDYVFYDGVYIINGSDGTIRMGYDISAHYVASYYNSSDGPKPGEVIEIKGSKYAITSLNEFDSGKMQIGPVMVKKISDTGDLDPDRAVTIAENYKVFYDQNSYTSSYVYFYEGNSLLDTYEITDRLSASTKVNDAVELGSFENKYNIYLVTQDTDAGSIGMSFVDKDQIFDLTDEKEGVFDYDLVWINNEDWNNSIVLFSPVIQLAWNDTIELPGTHYVLEWTDDKKLDIKRKFQVVVPDVSTLKALRYDEFLTDNINVTIVETGINVTWSNGSVVVANGSMLGASQYPQFLSTDIYIEILVDTETSELDSGGGTPSSSSSGGGGGGGGGATSFEAWIKNVLAGQTIELEIDDEDIPYIKGLSLTAKQDIYSSKLSITDYDKKPWSSMKEPDANVFRYFKVSYDKNNYVESAKFKVSVNKSWLKDNDIDPYKFSLYHYTNDWVELDSEILKEDDENIYFEVTTPGFSYFSLGGENGSGYRAIAKEEISAPVEEETVESPKIEMPTPAPPINTPEPEEPVKAPEEDKGGICGPTVVVLLAMLVLLFRRR